MIKEYLKDAFCVPLKDFGIVTHFTSTHRGLDMGYVNNAYENVYPIQEGTVIDVDYSSSAGNLVCVEHTYEGVTGHRWSAYIHLKSTSVKIGDKVYPLSSDTPTSLGVRGNTGQASRGVHLHLYVTSINTFSYNWNKFISQASSLNLDIDPEPNLYKTKKVTNYTGVIFNSLTNIEDIPEPVTYPEPVDRNTKVKQVNVLIDYLFMRSTPGGTAYDNYAKKGIYNIQKEEVNGNYCWYLIDTIKGKQFWVASGGTRTEDLPAELSAEEVLQKKVDDLEKKNKDLENTVNEKNNRITSLEADLKASKEELEKSKATTNDERNAKQEALKQVELLNTKISNAVKELA